MTRLLFGGPASTDELAAALRARRGMGVTTPERLQPAGYARFQPGGCAQVEPTEHSRTWIDPSWEPLPNDRYPRIGSARQRHLILRATSLRLASGIQKDVTKTLGE